MKKDDLIPNFKKRTLRLVLCLYGAANIGKSETLTGIGRALLNKSRYYYEQKGQQASRDRRLVLKYRRHIIGIGTYGDDQNAIDRNFKFFKDQGCDIGITAARVGGGTDMLSYVKRICKGKATGVAAIKKCNVTDNEYAQEIVRAACIEQFVNSLKCSGIKEVRRSFETACAMK